MIYVTEAESAALASHELAFEAVREALIAASAPTSAIFPVVIGHAADPQNRFTVKSATAGGLAGLKVGSYFPSNDLKQLPRHNSTILLFDLDSGRIGAIVEAGRLNAYRTAAADAVATHALAREDARTLALFGTGHQAAFEAPAICRIRPIERVLVVGRSPDRAEALVEALRAQGVPAQAAEAQAACEQADIIVTATNATCPLFHSRWVKSGTHISSMGSDEIGKQELPPAILMRASLFCDLPDQSRRIGEFQHAPSDACLIEIGQVLATATVGRANPEEITIFDSSGMALQDLFVAKAVIDSRQLCV